MDKFHIGPEAHHEGVEFGAADAGEFYDEGAAESMLDEFFFFFAQQALAETNHPLVASELEHADKFIEIETGRSAGSIGGTNAWFSEIKGIGIIDAVLNGIALIILWLDHYFGQLRDMHVKRNFKIADVDDGLNSIFGRGLAQVRKPDGICIAHKDQVPAGTVGYRARARSAHHGHRWQRHRLRHIKYATAHAYLAGNLSAYCQQSCQYK